ncbi:MAG: methyltransferase domain-containing protein [Gammaproteobacteria bacterium]|nr:methyltransferase domain-containing protein [Gammaproteobacteria bacterium]
MSEQRQKSDRIFDGWAERFDARIYADNNPKGLIREAVLRRDLREAILDRCNQPLNIIDVGGGLGRMAIWLAGQGHRVTLAEPSADMLKQAKSNAAGNASNTIVFLQKTLQDLPADHAGEFDLVVCHAVLEWLARPRGAIGALAKLLRDDGILSLMFYNKHSAMMRSLVVGDFNRVESDNFAGDGKKRLAPISPTDPDEVRTWLTANSLLVTHWSGVRTFYDYMLPDVRLRANSDDVLRNELRLSTREPWRGIARYQHMICRYQATETQSGLTG